MHRLRIPSALVVLALALAACGPSPDQVCTHVIDLMKAELDAKGTSLAEDQVGEIHDKCVARSNKNKELNGALEYKKEAQCVMAAQSLAAIGECGEQPAP